MTRALFVRKSAPAGLRAAILAVSAALLLTACQGGGAASVAASADASSALPTSTIPELTQGSIVSADGLYLLMPDFHCRDDGPGSEDTRCLTLECPPTADSAAEGRPVIWKRALRTISNPGWHDWVPVSAPTCFYDPHA